GGDDAPGRGADGGGAAVEQVDPGAGVVGVGDVAGPLEEVDVEGVHEGGVARQGAAGVDGRAGREDHGRGVDAGGEDVGAGADGALGGQRVGDDGAGGGGAGGGEGAEVVAAQAALAAPAQVDAPDRGDGAQDPHPDQVVVEVVPLDVGVQDAGGGTAEEEVEADTEVASVDLVAGDGGAGRGAGGPAKDRDAKRLS